MIDINDFTQVNICVYKGELYSVRDNGAILRHKREGKPKRPKDEIWTFGSPNDKGYACICGEQVHRIVATAFIGEAPTPQHIVDHIDTNRQNNRPENLRWLTKLENILNNEFTRTKVEFICGSIENFLNNPSLLFNHEVEDPNFKWMRAVTKEEAKATLDNMKNWIRNPKPSLWLGNPNRDWIFSEQKTSDVRREDEVNPRKIDYDECKHYGNSNNYPTLTSDELEDARERLKILSAHELNQMKKEPEPSDMFKDSLTPMATQAVTWRTLTEFPQCPSTNTESDLKEYLNKLKPGTIFSSNTYGTSFVCEAAFSEDGNIIVKCDMPNNPIKRWSICTVEILNGKFAHSCFSSFFEEVGADKFFTLMQGKEWVGGEVFDELCM